MVLVLKTKHKFASQAKDQHQRSESVDPEVRIIMLRQIWGNSIGVSWFPSNMHRFIVCDSVHSP